MANRFKWGWRRRRVGHRVAPAARVAFAVSLVVGGLLLFSVAKLKAIELPASRLLRHPLLAGEASGRATSVIVAIRRRTHS